MTKDSTTKISSPVEIPRRPSLALPWGSCDSHIHVYGPANRFPFDQNRPYTPNDAPVERIHKLHQQLGIDRAVYVQATVHGYDNSAVLDAIQRTPNNSRGVALVHTDISDYALQELHVGGIRGVRFNFIKHLGDAPNVAAVLRLAERLSVIGWHIQFHFSAQDLLDQLPMLQRMQCPYVIDHMGRTLVADGLKQDACLALLEVLTDSRAWIKLSGAERISTQLARGGPFPYADVVPFARQLLDIAPERTVWGTDWPHPNVREMPDDGDLVDLLTQFGDDSTLHRVLVTNPALLYDFDQTI